MRRGLSACLLRSLAQPARAASTAKGKGSFSAPKLHHINIVSRVPDELLHFYRDVMKMDEMPTSMFPRTAASSSSGTDVPIKFTTDGAMQMHLAQQDLSVGFRNGEAVNPIERGHIAFRTDDIEAFKKHLDAHGVHYSDYGTAFAKEWHQIFFLDPEGTVVEVHSVVA
jgi:catechol 2,3-dioxygenase-like lactoylglutathione lyase family enzyme